jgi:hypothetical protein
MRRASTIFILCIAAFAAGPAAAAEAAAPPAEPCLHRSRIVTYRDLNETALIVKAIGGKWYRVDLAGGCLGLDDMISVGVRQHGVGICVQKGDEITYNYHGFGQQRCLITGVSPYTPDPGPSEDND